MELASCGSAVTAVRSVARSVRERSSAVIVRVFVVLRLACAVVTFDAIELSGELTESIALVSFCDARLYESIDCWKSALAAVVSEPLARAESNLAIEAPIPSMPRCHSSIAGLSTLAVRL